MGGMGRVSGVGWCWYHGFLMEERYALKNGITTVSR